MVPPIEPVTNLLTLLLERRAPLTLQQIFDELEGQYPGTADTQRSMFERDKSMLRQIGVPIDTEVLGGTQAGQTGYLIDRRKYELHDLQLDDDERHALQMAVATIRSDPGQEAVWKLGGSAVPATTVMAHLPQLDGLPPLRAAIADRATVAFLYRGEQRRVDPYGLLLREGYWYVIGFDHVRSDRRTFRVDRIDGEIVAGDAGAFDVPPGFDPRAEFPNDPKRLGDDDTDPQVAQVAVYGPVVGVVRAELGDAAVADERPDGSVVFTVHCTNRGAFRSWVLGLGTDVEVLGPPEVRADLVAWLQALVAGGGAR
jgi:predicted DNA-binding transcriptional regulator YafY